MSLKSMIFLKQTMFGHLLHMHMKKMSIIYVKYLKTVCCCKYCQIVVGVENILMSQCEQIFKNSVFHIMNKI